MQSIDEEAAELSGQYSPGSARASMRPVRDIGGGGGGGEGFRETIWSEGLGSMKEIGLGLLILILGELSQVGEVPIKCTVRTLASPRGFSRMHRKKAESDRM